MTELLQRAIAKMERLPAEAQDAIAARILAELDDDREWSKHFAATSDDQWGRMAETARQEIARSDTTALEELLSPRPPEG